MKKYFFQKSLDLDLFTLERRGRKATHYNLQPCYRIKLLSKFAVVVKVYPHRILTDSCGWYIYPRHPAPTLHIPSKPSKDVAHSSVDAYDVI